MRNISKQKLIKAMPPFAFSLIPVFIIIGTLLFQSNSIPTALAIFLWSFSVIYTVGSFLFFYLRSSPGEQLWVENILEKAPYAVNEAANKKNSPRQAMELVFDSLLSKNRTLEKNLLLQSRQLRELLIEKVVRGQFSDIQHMKITLRMMEIDFTTEDFLMIIIRITDDSHLFFDDKKGSDDKMQARLIIRSVFEEMLNALHICFPTTIQEEACFLINLQNIDADNYKYDINQAVEQIGKTCEDAARFIEENFSMKLLTCIGAPIHGLSSINGVYETAKDIREYSMSLKNPPAVLMSYDFPETREESTKNITVERQYLNAIIAFDFKTACKLTLEKMDEQIKKQISGMRELKPFLENRLNTTSNLLSVSFETIVQNGRSAADDLASALESVDTDDIRNYLTDLFDKLDAYFNKTVYEVGGTTGKVIQYVYANYTDPSLSVETICEGLGKSRSYLSRMFKENTNMNLLDFLHTTRINQAKKLLSETNLNIASIAEKVGYYSGWTLARVFKRYEGITPSAYRDAYKNSPQNDLHQENDNL